MFLLDTDHLTIMQRRTQPEYGHLALAMMQFPQGDFCVSIEVDPKSWTSKWVVFLLVSRAARDHVDATKPHPTFRFAVEHQRFASEFQSLNSTMKP